MALDLATGLISWLERIQKRLIDDLLATPEAQRNSSLGGISRSPHYIIAECALVNRRLATALTGEPLTVLASEERVAFLEKFVDTEETLAYLKTETDALIAIVRATDPDTWDEMLDLFAGRPAMSRFDTVVQTITHMSYHDGQLNYVHMLCGDGAIHWK